MDSWRDTRDMRDKQWLVMLWGSPESPVQFLLRTAVTSHVDS